MTPTSKPSAVKSLKHPIEDSEASAPKSNAKKTRLNVENAAGGKDVTEPSEDESNNVKKHSGKLYYEDGNVVLISEKVAFRAHRMFLASRSEVFKDVFELGTHPKDGECFDGCPAIHLDDKVDDLTAFLEALYGHIDVKNIEDDFPKFSAVLRLSTKYMVDTLRSSCLSQLSLAKVPQTQSAYDDHYGEARAAFYRGYLKLVYDVGAICLLPSAFYILSTFDTPAIDKAGFPLTADVMLRLYNGRTKLFEIYAENVHDLRQEEKGDCSQCRWEKRSIFKEIASELTQPQLLADFDPLKSLSGYHCGDLCGFCLLDTKSVLNGIGHKIWDALPKIFNFGNSWRGLKDDMSVWSPQNQLK